MNNMLDEQMQTYGILYSNEEPMEMVILVNKTNNGWREEKVTSTQEQTGKEQLISRETQPKRVNNKNIM